MSFFKSKSVETVADNSEAVVRKVRNILSRVVGGKAITDDAVFSEVRSRQEVGKNEKRKSQNTNVKSKSKKQEILVALQQFHSPAHPHTMFQIVKNQLMMIQVCCKCTTFSPNSLHEQLYSEVVIVNWARCDFCSHWTHLRFCCPERVVRRNDIFKCPWCRSVEE